MSFSQSRSPSRPYSQHWLPRTSSTRVVSSLNRSKDLLSVESELKELLKNSHFNDKQKQAFWEMLETTFDLFQSPLQNGNHNESLIDSSSLELYSKMQSLVTALSSLIMNEEEELARQDKSMSFKSQENDSTEFSDGENEELHTFPKSASISNLKISSQNNSRRSSITNPFPKSKRSSLYFNNNSSNLSSPRLNSPSYYEPPPQQQQTTHSIRQNDKYRGLEHNPLRQSFKALQTPIPRSFSGRSERPKSMYVGKNDFAQTPPLPSYSSPAKNNYEMYDHNQFTQEFGSEMSFDHARPRRDSNLSNLSSMSTRSKSKRYSMRF